VAPIRAALIDIDGVLTVSWRPLPGAVEAVTRLREKGLAVALLTNTTSRTRASVASTLVATGFPVGADDVFTAQALTASYLADRYPGARCALLNSGDIRADLAGVTIVDDDSPADVGVLGGVPASRPVRPELRPVQAGLPALTWPGVPVVRSRRRSTAEV
jgi:HAD superfamily hydrolase (TIGR01450 family)